MYREITGEELIWHVKGYNQAMKEIMNFCKESIEIYEGDTLFDYSNEEKQIFQLVYQICKSKIRKI